MGALCFSETCIHGFDSLKIYVRLFWILVWSWCWSVLRLLLCGGQRRKKKEKREMIKAPSWFLFFFLLSAINSKFREEKMKEEKK